MGIPGRSQGSSSSPCRGYWKGFSCPLLVAKAFADWQILWTGNLVSLRLALARATLLLGLGRGRINQRVIRSQNCYSFRDTAESVAFFSFLTASLTIPVFGIRDLFLSFGIEHGAGITIKPLDTEVLSLLGIPIARTSLVVVKEGHKVAPHLWVGGLAKSASPVPFMLSLRSAIITQRNVLIPG